MISQVDTRKDDFDILEFSIIDFCKRCGIDYENGGNYASLKRHIKDIADKSIWIEIENGQETLLRWIEKPYIDKRNGTIRLRLDRDMKPFLLQLKANFTQYELVYTLLYKSKYSSRLYEFLKAIHYNKKEKLEYRINIEELKKRMGAETYSLFADFHRRALKPAVNEINQFGDITVEYDFLKGNGKTVNAIVLFISPKSTKELLAIWGEVEEKTHHGQKTFFGY